MKRAWLRTFLVALVPAATVAACMSVGIVLSRIDNLRAEQRATAAQVRLVAARLELARVEFAHRDVKPDNAALTCVRRTDALRAAIFALVRTGNASMVGDPSWEWAAWR